MVLDFELVFIRKVKDSMLCANFRRKSDWKSTDVFTSKSPEGGLFN